MVEHNSKQVKYLMAVSGKFTSGAAGAGLKLQTVRRKSKSSAGLTATDSVFAGRVHCFADGFTTKQIHVGSDIC